VLLCCSWTCLIFNRLFFIIFLRKWEEKTWTKNSVTKWWWWWLRAQNDEQMGWVGCMYLSHATLCKTIIYTTYSSIRFSSRKHQHERWLGQSFRLVIISADPVFPPLILFQTKNENWEAINSSSFPQKNYAPVWPTCSHNGTALSRRGRHIVISRAGWAGPVTVSRVPPGRCRGRHMDRPQWRRPPLEARHWSAGQPLVFFRAVAIAVAALTGAGCWPLTWSPLIRGRLPLINY